MSTVDAGVTVLSAGVIGVIKVQHVGRVSVVTVEGVERVSARVWEESVSQYRVSRRTGVETV